jgi:hypothetical protein
MSIAKDEHISRGDKLGIVDRLVRVWFIEIE